eukprot:6476996-Heterocapsa_arctica.AAC.1
MVLAWCHRQAFLGLDRHQAPAPGEARGRSRRSEGSLSGSPDTYGRAGYVKVEHRLQSAIDNHARAT